MCRVKWIHTNRDRFKRKAKTAARIPNANCNLSPQFQKCASIKACKYLSVLYIIFFFPHPFINNQFFQSAIFQNCVFYSARCCYVVCGKIIQSCCAASTSGNLVAQLLRIIYNNNNKIDKNRSVWQAWKAAHTRIGEKRTTAASSAYMFNDQIIIMARFIFHSLQTPLTMSNVNRTVK